MTRDAEDDPFARRDAARDFTRAAMRVGVSQNALNQDGAGADPGPGPQAAARPRSPRWLVAGSGLVMAAAVAGVMLRPTLTRAPQAAQAAVRIDLHRVTQADEAAVLAAPQDKVRAFRLNQAPSVLVLAFPSLHEQALMLDRVGAFVEKAGMPHDRVMQDAELAARIAQAGEDFDSFYYGHDYRAADLQRFFAAADAGPVTLDADERALRALLTQEGMLQPGAVGAVISLPPLSVQPPVDAGSRATILRHEVSHGVYFTNPAYAAYTQHFWAEVMTDRDRAAFRKMLGGEGYDTANEDLMRNEMQAYLVHTPDRRFFEPSRMGIDAASLRQRFVAGMPPGWLRDETPLH
jgi:hypothetical protein